MPVPIQTLSRCNARCKRSGLPCQQPAMKNGRCRLHGGKSTGPRMVEGRKAIAKARTIHGCYSSAQREIRELLRWFRKEMGESS